MVAYVPRISSEVMLESAAMICVRVANGPEVVLTLQPWVSSNFREYDDHAGATAGFVGKE